jgi:integrative and conjugative element protein (TIGR02256 family)
MLDHRQTRPYDTEAGGQLFARLSPGQIKVEVATGPRHADRRSRFYFAPSRVHERREIHALHRSDLHYVGDWHTHPESVPKPSDIDLRNISEIFTHSKHDYAGILMVIVGQLDPPTGIFVGIANCNGVSELVPRLST